jgi:hypothetical protein
LKIPNSFKTAISSVFYDKEVTLYEVDVDVDDEGWAREEVEPGDSILCNVWFDKLAELREEYGVIEDIDIAISTQEQVDIGAVIGYGGRIYKVVESRPFETYNLLMGREWSLRLKD